MAEVEFYVQLLFEEVGTAFGIAKIFGDVAASVDFEGDRTALEGSAHGLDALAMRVVEALGNANERGKTACDALVVIVEDGVGRRGCDLGPRVPGYRRLERGIRRVCDARGG